MNGGHKFCKYQTILFWSSFFIEIHEGDTLIVTTLAEDVRLFIRHLDDWNSMEAIMKATCCNLTTNIAVLLRDGNKALHWTAFFNSIDVVRMLL